MSDIVQSKAIEMWPLERLKVHPENEAIFEQPEATGETFATVLGSIKENGIWEPLLAKADGTILAGHLRRACAEKLGLKEVPVRVWTVSSYREEMNMLIRSNTDRRQLTKQEIALAYARLKQLPKEEGGAKRKAGRRHKGEINSAQLCGIADGRDDAAKRLGVGRREAEACETVFTTPGVPDEVKSAVNDGRLAPTTTADKIRAEAKRQGGELKSGAPLVSMLDPNWDKRSDHEKRLEAQIDRFEQTLERLGKMERELRGILVAMPLASLLGPTEQQDYRDHLQGIANLVYLEIHGAEMNTKTKAALTIIDGGKKK